MTYMQLVDQKLRDHKINRNILSVSSELQILYDENPLSVRNRSAFSAVSTRRITDDALRVILIPFQNKLYFCTFLLCRKYSDSFLYQPSCFCFYIRRAGSVSA